jgi:hypothetical protein
MERYEDRSRPEVDPDAGPTDVNEPPLGEPRPPEPAEGPSADEDVELDQSHTARQVMAESLEEREASAEREPSRAAQATEPEALEGEEGVQPAS